MGISSSFITIWRDIVSIIILSIIMCGDFQAFGDRIRLIIPNGSFIFKSDFNKPRFQRRKLSRLRLLKKFLINLENPNW